MAEICTELVILQEGVAYTPATVEYVITENHTLSDILRFVMKHGSMDKQELKHLIDVL